MSDRNGYMPVKRVIYNPPYGYEQIPMTTIENTPKRLVKRAPGIVDVIVTDDTPILTKQKESPPKREAVKIDLARSIYSAGTVKCPYFPAVFATFVAQSFILYLFVSEDGLTFTSTIGYDGQVFELTTFKRALGRFICFVVILIKGQEDLQNSLDLMFTIYRMGIICGILQIMVSLFLPVAFVYSLSSSTSFFVDITKTGLLLIFIELDTHVYNLVLMGHKRKAAEIVRTLKIDCECNGVRKWVRKFVMPLYMFGFFFITWYAALEQYPLAFLFFFLTIGIYLTPYFD